jgi:hypothetical protein
MARRNFSFLLGFVVAIHLFVPTSDYSPYIKNEHREKNAARGKE